MSKTGKKWLKNALRWGIAVFGIWYVLNNMSWSNRVLIPGAGGWPVAVKLADDHADENAAEFRIIDETGAPRTIPRTELLAKVDTAHITAKRDGVESQYDLIAQRVTADHNRSHWPYVVATARNLWQRYWTIKTGAVETIPLGEIPGVRPSTPPYPLVDRGIGPMLHDANKGLLLTPIFVFPMVFF